MSACHGLAGLPNARRIASCSARLACQWLRLMLSLAAHCACMTKQLAFDRLACQLLQVMLALAARCRHGSAPAGQNRSAMQHSARPALHLALHLALQRARHLALRYVTLHAPLNKEWEPHQEPTRGSLGEGHSKNSSRSTD
jgi:hypothetical protein